MPTAAAAYSGAGPARLMKVACPAALPTSSPRDHRTPARSPRERGAAIAELKPLSRAETARWPCSTRSASSPRRKPARRGRRRHQGGAMERRGEVARGVPLADMFRRDGDDRPRERVVVDRQSVDPDEVVDVDPREPLATVPAGRRRRAGTAAPAAAPRSRRARRRATCAPQRGAPVRRRPRIPTRRRPARETSPPYGDDSSTTASPESPEKSIPDAVTKTRGPCVAVAIPAPRARRLDPARTDRMFAPRGRRGPRSRHPPG